VRAAYSNGRKAADTVVESRSPTREGQRLSRLLRLVRPFGRRDLAKDTIMGFAYEGSVLLSTLLSFSLLGHSLGTEGFGDYAGLYSIAAPLITLASTGVALAQAQHVVREHEDLERTARSCFSLSLVGGLLMTVIGTILAIFIVRELPLYAIVPIFLLEFVSYPAVLIAANTVQCRDGYAASTPLRLVPMVMRIVILIVLFALDRLTIATLGTTFLIATALLSIVQIRRVSRRYGITLLPGRIDKAHLKSSLVYSSGVSGLAVQNDGDKTVLAAYHYRHDLGLYSAAYKIVQFGLIPVNTWMSISHNRFLEHDEHAHNQHLRRALKFGGVCAAYGLAFAVGVIVAAPLITLVVGNDFEGSVTMVRWLAPLVLLRALAIFPLNGLMGLGYPRLRTGLLLSAAALSLTMYITLIPLWQWKGAAVGTLFGEACLALSAWVFLLRLQRRHNESLPTGPDLGWHEALPPEAAPSGAH
jgi:O-antigen/teichoic acid export membrane protein